VAVERLLPLYAPLDKGNRRVTRVAHNGENRLITLRDASAHEAGPGEVGIHAHRFFGPQVDEHKVPGMEGGRILRGRLKMRVSAVGVDSHDRRMVGGQPTAGEVLKNELLHGILGHRRMLTDISKRLVYRLPYALVR